MKYEVVIGLEVHVQLNTKSKIFCGCSTAFGAEPNTQTCPVCQGHPGVLPVLNREVLKKAVMAGLAFECRINPFSKFDRKNYFYPDLPKAYQISQYDLPICEKGFMEVLKSDGQIKRIGITRMHMEEDAGKLVHSEVKSMAESYVDLNRSSTPLIEIVSEPDIRDAEEAVLYVQKLRQTLKFLGVSDVNMEEGSLRCDVNISLRPFGQEKLGTRAEIKNLNSFRSIQKAIEFEVDRQTEILEQGGQVIQETRLYNPDLNETRSMRTKEEANDYRYFPDPDLVPMVVTPQELESIRASMPDLPQVIEKRLMEIYQIKAEDAKVLTTEKEYAAFLEEAAKINLPAAQKMANFMLSDIFGNLKDLGIAFSEMKMEPKHLAKIFSLIDEGMISLKIAKEILSDLIQEGQDPEEVVKAKGLIQISDTGELRQMIEEIVKASPENIAQYHAGKTKVTGFFVGQIMKASKGKANPQMVNQILLEVLDSLK